MLHLVEAQIDVENENRDKSEAATDEEMVDAEISDKKLENKHVEENQSKAVEDMGTRDSEQV